MKGKNTFFEIDDSNIDFKNALKVLKGSEKLIFITGKAGTGKTTFLNHIKKNLSNNLVVLAPTGISAVNAGGQTINSFFQIKPSIYEPNDKRLRTKSDSSDSDKSTIFDHFKYFKDRLEIIKSLEILLIDEVSMLRCDILDVIDTILRVFRNEKNQIFGGVKIVLIGDVFQLPPVANFSEWDVLKKFYESAYFFSSSVIKNNNLTFIEFQKVYRQTDENYLNLLNKIRISDISNADLEILNSKYNPSFSAPKNINYITLSTHTKDVDIVNISLLDEINNELIIYESEITGSFLDNALPADKILKVKIGAQIMFIKNDKIKGIFNGQIGIIEKIGENNIHIKTSSNGTVIVERERWNNIKYTWDENEGRIKEEIVGTFIQFPIRLAWAITVHKSQGLTFDNVIASLDKSFTAGQVYVALSRCTSFSGLVLTSKISKSAIMVDKQVLKFSAKYSSTPKIPVPKINSGHVSKKTKDEEFIKKLNTLVSNNQSLNIQLDSVKRELSDLKESYRRTFNLLQKREYMITLQEESLRKIRKEFEELVDSNDKLKKLKWYQIIFK